MEAIEQIQGLGRAEPLPQAMTPRRAANSALVALFSGTLLLAACLLFSL